MKITDFETFVVGNPPPSFGGRYWIFVKVVTDDNIVGYGEVYSLPFDPHVVEAMIKDVAEQTFRRAKGHYGGDAWSPKMVQLLEDAMGIDLRAEGFPPKLWHCPSLEIALA